MAVSIVANTRTLNLDGATSPIQWRKLGETVFKPGPPLVGGRAKFIMLEPNTTYEVLANGVVPQSVTTRSEAVPKKSGGRTLEATPATLASVLGTLLPGDTLQLRGGDYRIPGTGQAVAKSGAPDNYITITAYPNETPVITGDLGLAPTWSQYAGTVWKAPVNVPTGIDNIWEGDSFLWRYSALVDLQALSKGPGGFFHDKAAGVLYLSTTDGGDPNTRVFHISPQTGNWRDPDGYGLLVSGNYLEITGLSFKYVDRAVALKGQWDVIRGCHGLAVHHVVETQPGALGCMVMDCQGDGGPGYMVYKRFTYTENWPHGRGIWWKANAVSFEAMRNNFTRFTEGISGATWGQETNVAVNPNADIHDNEVSFCMDDGVEGDGAAINYGVWGNKVHDVFDCCSLAPLKVGPAYVFKNLFWRMNRMFSGGLDRGHGVKTGAGSAGLCYFFHNTLWGPQRDSADSNGISAAAAGTPAQFLAWNNIFSVSNAIATVGTNFKGDYNILYTTAAGVFIKNNLTVSSLAAWQQKTGWEMHSFQKDPGFANPPSDFTPAIGANLGTLGPLLDQDMSYFEQALGWSGVAPDIGAIEVGGPAPAPTSKFGADQVSGYVPLTINFSDQSTGPILTWAWDFGDGTAFSGQAPPSHVYTVPKTYSVSLTVTGPGGTSSSVLNIIALAITAPLASFTGSPTTGVAPLVVSFADKSTGIISTWAWDFGDGNTFTGQTPPPHQYSLAGDYTARLTATGPGGTSTAGLVVTVLAAPLPPVANMEAVPNQGVVPLSVQFTDKSTGQITSRLWTFGDGTSSTDSNPIHTYTAPGEFIARLTVSDPGGSSSDSAIVTAQAPPPPVTHRVTVTTSGPGTTTPLPGTYEVREGDSFVVSATPNTGATFLGWGGDLSGMASPTTLLVARDLAISASFATTVRLTLVAGSGGTTVPAPGTYTYTQGSLVGAAAVPAAGYQFVEWQGGGATFNTQNPLSLLLSQDISLSAVFSPIPVPPGNHALTVSVVGQGTTTPVAGSYTAPDGSLVTLSAQASQGWRFDHWGGDAQGTGPLVSFNITRDMSVTAVFTQLPQPLGISPLVPLAVMGGAIVLLGGILKGE